MNVNDVLSEGQSLILASSPVHEKNDLRRATRSQSRVENLTKSPSPGLSKQTAVPSINLRSPVVQEAMEALLTKTRFTKSIDVDDDRDELDLIGSPSSHDGVRSHQFLTPKFERF